jgi:hypothetical protein
MLSARLLSVEVAAFEITYLVDDSSVMDCEWINDTQGIASISIVKIR